MIPIGIDGKICKGVYVRAYAHQWSDGSDKVRYIVRQDIQLRLLKKVSCKGCETCGRFWSWLYNTPENTFDLSEIENGKVYTPLRKELGRDFESGQVNDWEYVLTEVIDLL